MASDFRDILEVLREELAFLEQGGYRRTARAPWEGTSIFQHSPTCINYGYPYRAHPCNECHLLDFVGSEHQKDWIPCHSIVLNENNETIHLLELEENDENMELKVEEWLRTSIDAIEEERSHLAMAACP